MKINLDNKSLEIDKEVSIKDLLKQLEEAGLKDYTNYKIVVKNTNTNFPVFKEDKYKDPYNPLINKVIC